MKKLILILSLIFGGLFIGTSNKPMSTVNAAPPPTTYYCFWEMCTDCYFRWNECSVNPPVLCPRCHKRTARWIGYILISCTTPGIYPSNNNYCTYGHP